MSAVAEIETVDTSTGLFQLPELKTGDAGFNLAEENIEIAKLTEGKPRKGD